MKIELTKKGMTRWCQPNELEQMTSAGWSEAKTAVKELIDAPMVLRQPAKSKGADKSLDNANQQGD
jgi:aminoglycoside phosphotransferase (APT) family kinase protein